MEETIADMDDELKELQAIEDLIRFANSEGEGVEGGG
jgi:hypothetical protein